MSEIEKFIEDFKIYNYNDSIVRTFTNGYCYWFAFILNIVFDGTIVYLPVKNHFIFYKDSYAYDINGFYDLNDKIFIEWDKYQVIEPLESKRIIDQCILKK